MDEYLIFGGLCLAIQVLVSSIVFWMFVLEKPRTESLSISIISSHGEVKILPDGYVLSIERNSPPGESEFPDCYPDVLERILRFNTEEFIVFYGKLESEIDIVEIGYWERDWMYVPPDESTRHYSNYHRRMEEGIISKKDVTPEGGLFHCMMERMSGI